MGVIDVPAVCGEDIISRDAGRKVRELILSQWGEDHVEIRFSGRAVGSVSFFDEAIGLLLKKGGKTAEEMRAKLQFPDIRPEDRTLLNMVVTTRIR